MGDSIISVFRRRPGQMLSGSETASGGDVETVVFDKAPDSSDAGWAGFTVNNTLHQTNFITAPGQYARFTIEFTGFGIGATSGMWFGMAETGTGNFTGNQINVTFGGLGTITGDGTTLIYVSDWMLLGEAWDGTVSYVHATQFTGGVVNLGRNATSNSNGVAFKAGADAATTVKSGYTFHALNVTLLLTKIEIATSP